MLARPLAKAIYRPPTSIFRPALLVFFTPLKHLYHSVSQGRHSTDLAAPPNLTSTTRRSDQYWLLS